MLTFLILREIIFNIDYFFLLFFYLFFLKTGNLKNKKIEILILRGYENNRVLGIEVLKKGGGEIYTGYQIPQGQI